MKETTGADFKSATDSENKKNCLLKLTDAR